MLFSGANYQIDRSYIEGFLKDAQKGDILLMQNEISGLIDAFKIAKQIEMTLNGKSFKKEPHGCVIHNLKDIGAYDGDETNIDWFRVSEDIGNLLVKYDPTTQTVYCPKNYEFIEKFVRKLEAELELKSAFYEEIYKAYLNEFFLFLLYINSQVRWEFHH